MGRGHRRGDGCIITSADGRHSNRGAFRCSIAAKLTVPLEQHVMADAFERLVPIIERRLRPQFDPCRSPGRATSDTVSISRKKPA